MILVVLRRLAPLAIAAAALLGAIESLAQERAFVGLQVRSLPPEAAAALGWPAPKGVLVSDVALSGPGAAAGFARGDIILGFDGKDIADLNAIVAMIKGIKPAQKIAVSVQRGGKPMKLDLVPSEWPDTWDSTNNSFAKIPDLGLTLASMTAKVREQFGLRWGSTGVVVTLYDEARAGTMVEQMDIQRGEVIVQVNQADVWRPSQVVKAYQDAKAAGRSHLLVLLEGWEGKRNGYRFSLLPVVK